VTTKLSVSLLAIGYQNSVRYHHKWTWTNGLDDLFHQPSTGAAITRFTFENTTRRQFRFSKEGETVTALPESFIPVDVSETAQYLTVRFNQIFRPPQPERIPFTNSVSHLKSLLPDSLDSSSPTSKFRGLWGHHPSSNTHCTSNTQSI
jgi:hypothetical protein